MNKQRLLAVTVTTSLICGLILAAIYVAFLSKSFYTEQILDRVNAGMASSGLVLAVDSIVGNPVVGFVASGASFKTVDTDSILFKVPKLEITLAFSTLLSSSPRLARVSLYGADLDLDYIRSHMPKIKPSPVRKEIPINRIVLHDSELTTPFGKVGINKLTVAMRHFVYTVRYDGLFMDESLSARGRFDDNRKRLENARVAWGKRRVTADGIFEPTATINANFSGVDLGDIKKFSKAVNNVTLEGPLEGSLLVSIEGGAVTATGSAKSQAGQIWQIPYSNIATMLNYNGKTLALSEMSGRVFDAPATADVSLRFIPSFDIGISADLRDFKLAEAGKKFPWLDVAQGTLRQVRLDLAGSPTKLTGNFSASSEKFSIAGYECDEITARGSVKNGDKINALFSGKLFGANLGGSGSFDIHPSIDMNVAIKLAGLAFSQLEKKYPAIAGYGLSGSGDLGLRLTGAPSAIRLSGSFASPLIGMRNKKTQESFENAAAAFALSNDRIDVSSASVGWRKSKITASGYVTGLSDDSRMTYKAQGTISNLSIANLADYSDSVSKQALNGVLSCNWGLSGSKTDSKIDFSVKLPTLRTNKKFRLDSVVLDGSYSAPDVAIKKFSAGIGKGRATASGKITLPGEDHPLRADINGSFANINAESIASLAAVSADVSGDLSGRIKVSSVADKIVARADLNRSNIQVNKILLTNLQGGFDYSDGAIGIDDLKTGFAFGVLSADGKITLPEAVAGATEAPRPEVDIRVGVTSMDLGRLLRMYSPTIHGFQGLLNADVRIASTADDYSIAGDASMRWVRTFGLFIPRISSRIEGNTKRVILPNIQALAGRGIVDASVEVKKGETGWNAAVKAFGKNVDLRAITYNYLSAETRRAISGTLGFNFTGSGTVDSFRGRGRVEMPSVDLLGIKLTHVETPIFMTDGFVMLEDARARAYGGSISAQFARDLRSSKWGGRLSIKSADLAKFLKDAVPTMEGSISGNTNMSVRFEGDSRRTSMQDGVGQIEVTSGDVSGFEAMKQISKITGGRPIRFAQMLATFNVDGKTLNILPGSRVSSQRGDPVFKYVMADGTINMTKSMDVNISCIGNVNIRALNAFAGAIQGLLTTADFTDSTTLIQNFLGGAITGFSRNEFRDVNLTIKGTPGNMSVQNIVINQPVNANAIPDPLVEDDDTRRQKDEERIRIKLEFPVGPGGYVGNGDTGSQVTGQIMEQALKGALKFF